MQGKIEKVTSKQGSTGKFQRVLIGGNWYSYFGSTQAKEGSVWEYDVKTIEKPNGTFFNIENIKVIDESQTKINGETNMENVNQDKETSIARAVAIKAGVEIVQKFNQTLEGMPIGELTEAAIKAAKRFEHYLLKGE